MGVCVALAQTGLDSDDVGNPRSALRGAVAADEHAYPLLGFIADPRLVFDCRRLVTRFANEIVPTEVLRRGPPRRAIFYSAARY